jgi:hypothetical protein
MLLNHKKGTALALAFAAIIPVLFTGCGSGSGKNVKISGIDGPKVSFVGGKFLMTVAFKSLDLGGGLRLPIPNMPESYLEIAPDLASNGTLLAMAIATSDINALSKLNSVPPTELPGGRPLPGVINGQLPGFAVTVPQLNHVTFYIGPQVFGAFVPVRLGIGQLIGTFRFFADNGKQIGNISIVGEDDHKENSGFLLLVNLASSTVQSLMR